MFVMYVILKNQPCNLIEIFLSNQNTTYNEVLYASWGNHGSRTAMPSISRLQKMVEAAWAAGFDVQVILFFLSIMFLY